MNVTGFSGYALSFKNGEVTPPPPSCDFFVILANHLFAFFPYSAVPLFEANRSIKRVFRFSIDVLVAVALMALPWFSTFFFPYTRTVRRSSYLMVNPSPVSPCMEACHVLPLHHPFCTLSLTGTRHYSLLIILCSVMLCDSVLT